MTQAILRKLRCAVYTRKSSEEGLEQEFNSLHAQREACEAYIASQRSEGWVVLRDQFDDGGVSGGTLERPGIKALMQDIEDGLIDVVVVYKIDRLSRSLADFAKLVAVFDRTGVTFVSVTQQFNTTTSMGRLTLNTRKGDRLYRYDVSQTILKHGAGSCPIARVPAGAIESAVIDQVRAVFRQPEIIAGAWDAAQGHCRDISLDEVRMALQQFDPLWDELFPAEQARIVALAVERVDIGTNDINVRLRIDGLAELAQERMVSSENKDAAA
jgi:hypothetical protein